MKIRILRLQIGKIRTQNGGIKSICLKIVEKNQKFCQKFDFERKFGSKFNF